MGTQKNTKRKSKEWENVKLPAPLVEKLRKHKKTNLIPIGKFVEIAVLEKLEQSK
jgi:hypothetical protein